MLWTLLGENRERYELRSPQDGRPAGTPCWVHRKHGGLTLVLDFDDGTSTSLDGRLHWAEGLERPHWTEHALAVLRMVSGRATPQDAELARVVTQVAMLHSALRESLDDPEFENKHACREVLDE